MANIISTKKIKIKPENQAVAEGTIVRCRYVGSSKVGIGPFAKTTHIYKVFVEVEGLEKPLILKVKEKQDWNLGIVNDIKSAGKFLSGNQPVNEGERVTVIYDKTKPKKCNIAE